MILDEFARYAQAEAARALPEQVAHHAKRALIDWFSALFPGIPVAPGVQLMKAHAAELGHGRSSLPGQRTTAFPATAAWINGSISHAVEFDDIFRDAVYHPGCPTISAALAVAEDRGASGADLLKAITVGYEISTRIGAAVQPSHYKFFHTTGTVGCFGSAAATAALTGPGDADVLRHALATAASFASGLQQAFRSDAMTKALHAGHAAWVGVTAGVGAAAGITGALDILEGAAGFGAALSDDPKWERATDGLGTRYNITAITQKNHGCCGHTFAAIDAMLALREQGVDPQQIESIQVDTYKTALDVTGNFEPRTAFEAKFSLPYVVAHGLLYGAVRLNAFEPQRLADPAIRALMARTRLNADGELTAKFPNVRAARVTLTLRNGQVVSQFAPCRKGDPEAPLTDADLDDKFLELASPVIGDAPARTLLQQLWHIDRHELAALRLQAL
ncbi:MmgE/PrpD family protein [Ramlibacter sp.]|uniref:MmgE/PrpD family protein n=1 Tax=Ramlibacter sp. TaxID=1917967 RepID=UPI002BBBEB36|nr:MmgE/PrpD family protein [Ramlibacter sp.]HWI82118.1 MmgE/PrpD family protein [Ramlibacter sp.]